METTPGYDAWKLASPPEHSQGDEIELKLRMIRSNLKLANEAAGELVDLIVPEDRVGGFDGLPMEEFLVITGVSKWLRYS